MRASTIPPSHSAHSGAQRVFYMLTALPIRCRDVVCLSWASSSRGPDTSLLPKKRGGPSHGLYLSSMPGDWLARF
jgi:hypothetical protein